MYLLLYLCINKLLLLSINFNTVFGFVHPATVFVPTDVHVCMYVCVIILSPKNCHSHLLLPYLLVLTHHLKGGP